LNYINYLLLDGAIMESSIAQVKELNPKHESLYREKGDAYLANVGPYLFLSNHFKEFKAFFTEKGWGNSWGVMLKTNEPFPTIHTHFRKFLMVKTEDGEELYFRFYDPRVLRIFLPTCDASQLKEFFGPVEHFICEDEDPAFGLIFSLRNGQLETQRVPVEELFPKNLAVSESEANPENEPKPPVIQKEKSLTEQPLPMARFSGDPQMLKTYFSSLGSNQLGEYFSSVKSFYSPGENGTNSVFSFSQETQNFVVEEVSDEGLSKIIDKGEQTIKQNQKEYSESILKTKKEDPKSQNPDENKKPGRWSWLKI
jgi:hypothetical protein